MSECPSANELGLRSNPICVDGVDTSRYANLSDLSADTVDRVAVCCLFLYCLFISMSGVHVHAYLIGLYLSLFL